ncbi:hypothetical protein [Phenylobacterium sp.]|jgi:hypothetical protein|uniref:hypothetical protein n=1 Tax=Phenylobacterium sp. TaxID=1871053 RepID=UPI002F40D54D
MKAFTAAALAAVALLSAGCSGCQSPVFSDSQGVLSGTLADDKAMYVAEAAFNGANQSAIVAVDTGLLKPGSPLAVQIADDLKIAHEALIAGRTAYVAGDAKTYSAKISAAQNLLSTVWQLIPGKKAA